MVNKAFYEPQPRMCSRFFAISIYIQGGGQFDPPPARNSVNLS